MGSGHGKRSVNQISTLAAWEPRLKLLSGVLFIFGLVSLNDFRLLMAALLFTLCFALKSGLPLTYLLRRVALLLPFLTLMSATLIFGSGFPPPADRTEMALLIVLKAFTAMLQSILVFAHRPVEEMLEALEQLKVPGIVAAVIYLAYRYGVLFLDEVEKMFKALQARLFRAGLRSLPVYGEVGGGLILKSLNRSENVYRAMVARGFRGRIPCPLPRRIQRPDVVKAALFLLFISILIAVEKAVL